MDNKKKYHDNLIVSSAPHIVSDEDTGKLMGAVLLALLPALAASVYIFGTAALALCVISVVCSMAFEWLYNYLMKKPQTVMDLSAAVTGLLIAFNVPANLSDMWWKVILADFVAIIVVKQLYGGLGKNFVNPAITARIFLFISFASSMSTWPLPKMTQTADAVTGATPLAILAEGGAAAQLPSNSEMFLGFIGGSLGEVSALALLIGGIFLIWRKVISPIIPCAFLGTVFVFGTIASGFDFSMGLFHVLAGGAMLGAFFMATDYVTTPKLPMGKLIFGIGCGLITMMIRLYGSYPEGVSFSILLMNIITPLINRATFKSYIGGGAKNGK